MVFDLLSRAVSSITGYRKDHATTPDASDSHQAAVGVMRKEASKELGTILDEAQQEANDATAQALYGELRLRRLQGLQLGCCRTLQATTPGPGRLWVEGLGLWSLQEEAKVYSGPLLAIATSCSLCSPGSILVCVAMPALKCSSRSQAGAGWPACLPACLPAEEHSARVRAEGEAQAAARKLAVAQEQFGEVRHHHCVEYAELGAMACKQESRLRIVDCDSSKLWESRLVPSRLVEVGGRAC